MDKREPELERDEESGLRVMMWWLIGRGVMALGAVIILIGMFFFDSKGLMFTGFAIAVIGAALAWRGEQ